MITGRQILHMIASHFGTDGLAGSVYDLADLMAVRLKNDASLESFLTSRDSVLRGMKTDPPEDVKETLFLQQLSESQALKDEISHYHRADKGERDKRYDFLRRSVVRGPQKARREPKGCSQRLRRWATAGLCYASRVRQGRRRTKKGATIPEPR